MKYLDDSVEELVSVIVPVYNAAQYIESSLKSIMNQTYSHIEIVVVDDKSTDGTGQIVDRLAEADSRISVIHSNKTGVSGARNLGIQEAQGDWIMFCDSDDFYTEYTVELLLKNALDGDFDVVAGSHTVVMNSGIRRRVKSKNIELKDKSSIVEYFYTVGQDDNYIWKRIYKKRIFEEVAFRKGRFYEDIFFTLDMLNVIDSYKMIDTSVYDYIQRPSSLTGCLHKEIHMDALAGRTEQLEYAVKKYPELVPAAYDIMVNVCSFLLAKFNEGKISKKDEDYIRVIDTFKKYKKLAPKKSLRVKVVCIFFNISPAFCAWACKVYSKLRN